MKCKHCRSTRVIRFGIRNDKQRFRCKSCKRIFQESYQYKGSIPENIGNIKALVKEGMGIRNISRYLSISTNTVIRKIKEIAGKMVKRKTFEEHQCYQVDEMRTFIKNKETGVTWIFYSLNKRTKEVLDFVVGRRTSKNAKKLTGQLLQLSPKKINTDRLNVYPGLIPKSLHKTSKSGTNHIERNNLTMRVNLKRLQRKTICYSRSKEMLIACLTIFFWG